MWFKSVFLAKKTNNLSLVWQYYESHVAYCPTGCCTSIRSSVWVVVTIWDCKPLAHIHQHLPVLGLLQLTTPGHWRRPSLLAVFEACIIASSKDFYRFLRHCRNGFSINVKPMVWSLIFNYWDASGFLCIDPHSGPCDVFCHINHLMHGALVSGLSCGPCRPWFVLIRSLTFVAHPFDTSGTPFPCQTPHHPSKGALCISSTHDFHERLQHQGRGMTWN